MSTSRKVKDAKDLNTNELIYFTSHAKATYMTDGRNVEDAIKSIGSNGNGTGSSGSGAYGLVEHGTSDTTFTLTPNTFHVWDEVGELILTLGEETAGVANEYLFQFTSGTEPTVLTLPDSIIWADDETPVIESGYIYQVSVLKGFATLMKFKKNNIVFPLYLYDYNTPNEESIWLYNTIEDYCIRNDTRLFDPSNLDGDVYINDYLINDFEYIGDYIEVASPNSFDLGGIYPSGKVEF